MASTFQNFHAQLDDDAQCCSHKGRSEVNIALLIDQEDMSIKQ